MAAPRTQKRASASAKKTAAKSGRSSRASSSRATSARSGRKPTAQRGAKRPSAKRSARRTNLTAIAIVASLILAAWTIYPVFRLQYQHEREVRTLEAELQSLQSRNSRLRQEVEELKTPEGVERVARDTLGLVKPGEQAYVVTGGTIGETTGTVAYEPHVEDPLWLKVLDTLFGYN